MRVVWSDTSCCLLTSAVTHKITYVDTDGSLMTVSSRDPRAGPVSSRDPRAGPSLSRSDDSRGTLAGDHYL